MKQHNYQPVYNLIALLEDAKTGYLNAAEKIKDEVLGVLFENYGYQRGRYSDELKLLVEETGVISNIDFFTLTLLQRTWTDLKTSFKNGQQALITACIKAEEVAIKNYTSAIEKITDDNCEIKRVLQKQVNGIQSVLQFIKLYASKQL